MNHVFYVIPLLLVISIPTAFAQTETITGLMTLPEERIESFTFEKFQDGFTWELDEDGFLYKQWDADRLGSNPQPKPEYPIVTETFTIEQISERTFSYTTHAPYINDKHEWKPYILGEDDAVVQVQVNGGKFVFDKNTGAVTIFDDEGIIIKSDSYVVRTAILNSDEWNNLEVNNSEVETIVSDNDDAVVVSFVRENNEGQFITEYIISNGKVKTTAYFTNYIYDNHKFAFTQTVSLPDSIISLNDMEDIDLNDYIGQSFAREVLEENQDLILKIKDMYYNSGIGFENLWQVNIHENNTISLDYANVEQTQTAINETIELDPVYSFVADNYDRFNIYDSSYGVSGSTCTTPWVKNTGNISTNYLVLPSTSTTNNNCFLPAIDFDISPIPSTATVTDVSMVFDITGSTNPINCNYIGIDTTTANSASDIYTDITSTGVTMLSNDSTCTSGISNNNIVNFGSTGASELQSDLASGNFVVGIEPISSTRTSVTVEQQFKNQALLVTYTLPPSTPTNLSATYNSPNVDLSWTGSDSGSDYVVSSAAKTYTTPVTLPATWSLWQGGASPTTPTMGVPGVIGGAFDFNGSTDMVGNNFVTSDFAGNSQGSISIWIKPEASGSSVGNPFGGTGFQTYWITNTPLWSAYPSNSFNMGSLYSNANAFTMNAWNHVVVTIDSTTSNNTTVVYVNGSPVQMYTYPSGTGGGSASSSNSKTASNLLANTILGGQYHPSPQLKYPFDGKIDELSSWDKVLSQSEVTTLYNSGNGNTPDSINSNDNLITYFPLDETSSPLPNMAVTTDPTSITYSIFKDGSNTGGTSTTTTWSAPLSFLSASIGNTYDFHITAATNNGVSSNSNIATLDLTLPNAPTGLTASFNSPNVDLSWIAPSQSGGASISGYLIEHSTDDVNYTTLTTTSNTNTTYSHTSPTLGSLNYYKISGVSSLGTGDVSNTANTMAGIVPDPPTGLTSSIQDVDTNPLNVVLNFSSPSNVGSGTLTGFEVYRNNSLITTTGLVTSYTDTVTAGSHSYYLKSVSTHGTSGNSNTTNITTPTIPGTINDLSGSVISDTQINLSYSAPSDGGSNIDMYKIFKDGTQIDTTTNLNYSATGLTANTSYTFLVVANNSVGDSANSNSVNLTTYQSVSGSISVTTVTQGATTEFSFSPNNISGTPTPTFNLFTLMEGTNVIASGITSPYYLAHTDDVSKTYSLTSSDLSHWNSPTITGTITAQSDYAPNWNTQNISYNYTRNGGVMDLTVNKDNSQNTWNAVCSYKTTTEVIDGDPGIQSTHNGVWFISESQNINDADTVYVSCVDGSDTLFTFTSFGPNRLAGGIAQLDNVFGEWTGTPVALIFVLLVAGLFTGRSAPTGILLVLALIGVLGFIGMLTIDEAVWGFLLLAGVLGIFIGKRFL